MRNLIYLFVFCVMVCSDYAQQLDHYNKISAGGNEWWNYISETQFTDKKLPEIRYLQVNEKIEIYNYHSAVQGEQEKYWTLQNPYPTDAHLISVCSDNDFIITTGISINYYSGLSSAGIFTSNDNGNNWNKKNIGADTILIDIEMSGDTIWIAGVNNDASDFVLFKSTNRGADWEIKTPPAIPNSFYDGFYFEFFNSNDGLISILYNGVGNSLPVIKTTDGGESWTNQDMVFPSMIKTEKIFFLNPNSAWLGFRESSQSQTLQIAHTSNSGADWQIQYSDTAEELKTMYFSDELHGWIVYEQYDYSTRNLKICSTSDGGTTWNTQKIIEGSAYYDIFGCQMFALDSMNIWLGYTTSFDAPMTILKSVDGGVSWEAIQIFKAIDFQLGEIEFENLTTGCLVSSLGTILNTTDGGYTWERKNKTVTSALLQGVDFIDPEYGVIAGSDDDLNDCNAVIFNTGDGGENWSIILCDSNFYFIDVDAVNRNTTLGLAKSFTYYDKSYVYRTTDNGSNWDLSVFDTLNLQSIQTVGSKVWAVGSTANYDPAILFSSDAGGTWNSQTNINVAGTGLTEVCFTDELTGFAVGNNGIVLKTTNGGETWSVCWGNLDPNGFWRFYNLTSVYFINNTTGWITGTISGYQNKLIKTNDGGQTWDTLSIFNSGQVVFTDPENGWIFGNRVWITSNGGDSWEVLSRPESIFKADMVNSEYGWAVVSGGRIFKYYKPAIEVENNLDFEPRNYQLFQNYPNPFNPVTSIIYDIPEESYIALKIYNVLGEEVATLVNTEQMAGRYKVEWNADRYASGIYIYRIQTADYVAVKKMILVK